MIYSNQIMAQHMLIPSVYVLMVRDSDKMLMLHRRADDTYTIPNGPLLDGEKLLDAAGRVVLESVADRKANPGPMVLAHVMRRYKKGEDKIHFFYETQSWKFTVSIANPKIYDEIIWTDMGNMPKNSDLHVYDFVRYIYPRPKIYSELGWGRERVPQAITNVTWF